MSDKWPLANGNWSNAANWNGGTKPVPGDDVYADSRSVAIDENITVASLRSTQRSGGTNGGGFTTPSAVTVNANVFAGGSNCLVMSVTGCVLNGDTYGSLTSNVMGASLGLNCTHNGNSYAGAFSNAWGTSLSFGCVQNGNSYGGSRAAPSGSSQGTRVLQGAYQRGNSYGGTFTGLSGTLLGNGGLQIGDSFGGSGTNANGTNASGGHAIHIGNATGGTVGYGTNASLGTIVLIGVATGNTAGAYAVEAGSITARCVVIIKSEVGVAPKNLAALVETTAVNSPFLSFLSTPGATPPSKPFLNKVIG